SSQVGVGINVISEDRVEQSGPEIAGSCREAATQALAQAGARPEMVSAAGLACQRSSIICWDAASGEALSPVLSWQDRRHRDLIQELEPHGEEIHRRTGLFLTPHYGASKLRWCLDNIPAVARARQGGTLAWGPLASYLVYQLTRERSHLAEPQCASRMQLWSLETRDWDPWLLELFGLPAEGLPRSVPTICDFGTLSLPGTDSPGIPLRAVNGDQAAMLFGFGRPRHDTAYVNVGTGAFILRPTPQRAPSPRLLSSVVYAGSPEESSPVLYALEGSVNGAAAALDWLWQQEGAGDQTARLPGWLEERENPPLFLNGVSGLGSPYWRPVFPARFVEDEDADLAGRAVAVVESIAFLICVNLEEMQRALPPPRAITMAGGLSRLDGLCSRLADISGLPVERVDNPEATCRGLAFLLAGQPDNWPEPPRAGRFEPDAASPRALGLKCRYGRWREALEQALKQALEQGLD
ncbi:MAG: FGGY family carbohydrate kinase, partial [Deltaproteobacteria bacterium]|nr:FGGY family carbohydrate kinase [Deltaproteobacteria bacterium]